MYIILRGSISVRIRKAEYGEHPLIITTLPDGCHFGELAIFVAGEGKAKNDRYSEQNKRKASCLACEDTDLLAIPREATQKIILGQIQNKIDTELHFLKTITYFQVN
jgi:CRP-like cAMP-binding protein